MHVVHMQTCNQNTHTSNIITFSWEGGLTPTLLQVASQMSVGIREYLSLRLDICGWCSRYPGSRHSSFVRAHLLYLIDCTSGAKISSKYIYTVIGWSHHMVKVWSRHCFRNPGHLKEIKPEICRQRCEPCGALGRGGASEEEGTTRKVW